METSWTKESLIEFENKVAETFNQGKIRSPVHLHNGNEDQLLDIFKEVKECDWVLSSWRSHYHCLLKGVPEDVLFEDILQGRSISLAYSEQKVLCSGIVTGMIPVSVGIALDIKRRGSTEKVWCFIGDMTAETGIAHECIKYAQNFNLPVTYVVEDNSKSVCTDTKKTWGLTRSSYESDNPKVIYYKYDLSKYPHAGAGKRVQF